MGQPRLRERSFERTAHIEMIYLPKGNLAIEYTIALNMKEP